jgi:hypothetical protein
MFRSSPSGIGLTKLCVARAVAHYVWGYEEPENNAMREGTRLHRIVQAYLRDGTVPDNAEKAAHACIKVLPVSGGSISPHNIERVVLLPEHHGYLDWSARGEHGDLKFTKSVRYQQAKDPTQDPQRIMYAVDAFANDTTLVSLKQYWTVTQFAGDKALTLEHVWTKDSARTAYEAIVKPVHQQLAAAIETKLHWNDAPKNLSSCDTYPPNGCMMKSQGCRRSLHDRLIAIAPKRKPKHKDTAT